MSGFLVPSDSAVPLSLCPVQDSATAISDLLGGVLLDDARVLPLADGTAVTIYQGEDRTSLPVNDRLTVLATRLQDRPPGELSPVMDYRGYFS